MNVVFVLLALEYFLGVSKIILNICLCSDKKQVEELVQKQTAPETCWVNELVAENRQMKQQVEAAELEYSQLQNCCEQLTDCVNTPSNDLYECSIQADKWKSVGERMLLDLKAQQKAMQNITQREEAVI